MLEVLNIDQSVEVSADRQLTLEGAVDLVLDTGLEHLVHLSLQTSEVVLLRFARRDKEDALVRKAGVGAEIFTNDFHGLFLVKSHIPHSVFDFEINLSTNSEVRHTVAAHFLHKSKVGFGETTSGNDDDKIEVLDSHNAQVVVERELRGSGTGKVPKTHIISSRLEVVSVGVDGGFLDTDGSSIPILRLESTKSVVEGRLSGSGVTGDGDVSGSLVTSLDEPLRKRVRLTSDIRNELHRVHEERDSLKTSGEFSLAGLTNLLGDGVGRLAVVTVEDDEVSLALLGGVEEALNPLEVIDFRLDAEDHIGTIEIDASVSELADNEAFSVFGREGGRIFEKNSDLAKVALFLKSLSNAHGHGVLGKVLPPRHRVNLGLDGDEASSVGRVVESTLEGISLLVDDLLDIDGQTPLVSDFEGELALSLELVDELVFLLTTADGEIHKSLTALKGGGGTHFVPLTHGASVGGLLDDFATSLLQKTDSGHIAVTNSSLDSVGETFLLGVVRKVTRDKSRIKRSSSSHHLSPHGHARVASGHGESRVARDGTNAGDRGTEGRVAGSGHSHAEGGYGEPSYSEGHLVRRLRRSDTTVRHGEEYLSV
mmetsp:Transcript_29790/g.52300  ORF Transcript_29790/g.52300 Transcript_29790/m.52300 type:complete len:596 (-) Transcript_29790:37-1824(-)